MSNHKSTIITFAPFHCHNGRGWAGEGNVVITSLVLNRSIDGWMICDFTSFSAVFQSYHDDGRMIMKGCVQWTPFTVEKISPRAGLELRTSRSVGQRLTHWSVPSYILLANDFNTLFVHICVKS